MRLASVLCVVAVVACVVSASAALRLERDLQYATIEGIDSNLLSLDVYWDDHAPPSRPMILYVHGGGWQNGDKANVGLKADAFVARGWVFASTNYRLAPDASFPAHAQDVAAAFAWLRDHAEDFGGHRRDIVLMGHSAGAHLVALVSCDPRYLATHNLELSAISATVSNDTKAYDIEWLARDGDLGDAYLVTFGDEPEAWRFASPRTYIDPAANHPPMAVLYSGGFTAAGDPERSTVATAFADLLVDANVATVLVAAPELTHAEINQNMGAPGDRVTEEVFAFLDRRTSLNRLRFRSDLELGEGITATETVFLVGHKDRLFAAMSTRVDSSPEVPGAQILVKNRPGEAWQVDVELPRPGFQSRMMLYSVTVTTDAGGRLLDEPVPLLVASPQQAGGEAVLYARDDLSGQWTEMPVDPNASPSSLNYARFIVDHRDAITGVHHVFAGFSSSALYRGVYDALAPGQLVWDPVPELVGNQRMLSAATANGQLYVAVTSNGNPHDLDGGLFRRVDGPDPGWEVIWEWPLVEGKTANLRGLTAVSDPLGGDHEVLIGAFETDATVVRIDPMRGHEVTVEVNFRDLFFELWNGLGGTATLAAYNDMPEVIDPVTGAAVRVIGTWVNPPQRFQPPFNGAYYLVRFQNATYTWGAVWDPEDAPVGVWLQSIRTVVATPFPEETGRVLYWGGFDAIPPEWHDTAWIWRGEIPDQVIEDRSPRRPSGRVTVPDY